MRARAVNIKAAAAAGTIKKCMRFYARATATSRGITGKGQRPVGGAVRVARYNKIKTV